MESTTMVGIIFASDFSHFCFRTTERAKVARFESDSTFPIFRYSKVQGRSLKEKKTLRGTTHFRGYVARLMTRFAAANTRDKIHIISPVQSVLVKSRE